MHIIVQEQLNLAGVIRNSHTGLQWLSKCKLPFDKILPIGAWCERLDVPQRTLDCYHWRLVERPTHRCQHCRRTVVDQAVVNGMDDHQFTRPNVYHFRTEPLIDSLSGIHQLTDLLGHVGQCVVLQHQTHLVHEVLKLVIPVLVVNHDVVK